MEESWRVVGCIEESYWRVVGCDRGELVAAGISQASAAHCSWVSNVRQPFRARELQVDCKLNLRPSLTTDTGLDVTDFPQIQPRRAAASAGYGVSPKWVRHIGLDGPGDDPVRGVVDALVAAGRSPALLWRSHIGSLAIIENALRELPLSVTPSRIKPQATKFGELDQNVAG